VFAGTAIGVLPGLGPVAGAALILPFTLTLDPVTGLIMIAGIYYGAMYGGSTTAALLNIPGEAASVVTSLDGYQMTRRNRGGAALSIMAVGSFVAGTIAVVLVTFFSPVLANFGLLFGPPEFFALTAGGLLAFSRISGGSLASALLPMVIGILLATVGQEAITGQSRYTFGILELNQGVELVSVAIGLFGISEVMILSEALRSQRSVSKIGLREMMPTREEWKRSLAPWGRGTIVGFLFGLLPGPSATLSSFASYRLEKSVSRHRSEIGQGAVEGVAGPEAANNSAAIGSVVPVLTLGIPFSATLALMITAMVVQGVQPGPLLITQHPEVFWGVIASMYVGNIMLLILNLPMVGVWINLLRTPQYILIAFILLFTVIGTVSIRNSMLDVFLMVIFGVIGYVFRKLDFQLAPMIIGLVLGSFIEKHFRESLILSQGDFGIFLSSPITIGIWIIVLIVMIGGTARRLFK
jgi:putative tricarboxylic transport membrane protein